MRRAVVRCLPAHAGGEFVRLFVIAMLDRETAAYDIENMAFGAPMVSEIARIVVDDAQLNVIRLVRTNARAGTFSSRSGRQHTGPVDNDLRQTSEFHGTAPFSVISVGWAQ
jgi:hypothetical protein